MPHTHVPSHREQKKQPVTMVTQIASNPSLFTVDAGPHTEGGFKIAVYKSSEADRTLGPTKVHERSGFQNIALAVRALMELMSEVVEVHGTQFREPHVTALKQETNGKKRFSVPLRDIMEAVQ